MGTERQRFPTLRSRSRAGQRGCLAPGRRTEPLFALPAPAEAEPGRRRGVSGCGSTRLRAFSLKKKKIASAGLPAARRTGAAAPPTEDSRTRSGRHVGTGPPARGSLPARAVYSRRGRFARDHLRTDSCLRAHGDSHGSRRFPVGSAV